MRIKRPPPKTRDDPPAKKKKLIPVQTILVETIAEVDVTNPPSTGMEADESEIDYW